MLDRLLARRLEERAGTAAMGVGEVAGECSAAEREVGLVADLERGSEQAGCAEALELRGRSCLNGGVWRAPRHR